LFGSNGIENVETESVKEKLAADPEMMIDENRTFFTALFFESLILNTTLLLDPLIQSGSETHEEINRIITNTGKNLTNGN